MKLPIEVRGIELEFVIIRINGNDIAKLSHEQADELAGKLLTVTCRLPQSDPIEPPRARCGRGHY